MSRPVHRFTSPSRGASLLAHWSIALASIGVALLAVINLVGR